MNPRRLTAGGSITLTGVAVLWLPAAALLRGGLGAAGGVVAGFGVLVGLVLVGAGAWISQTGYVGDRALRVAGWNLLGVAALGSVLVLVSLSPGTRLPGFGAAVVVGVSAVAHVLIAVSDDGPGIPAAEREVLAGEREVTQLDHASGLGLRIVGAVAESHGGDLSFEDGTGTTVRLTLPAAG